MDQNKKRTLDLHLEKVAKNLRTNGFEVEVFAKKEEILPRVKELIPPGAKVAHGGSVTLSECGIVDLFKAGGYEYIDRDIPGITPEARTEAMRQALLSEYYLCSANALLEEGMIYNVDGNGNRTAATLYGPKKVIYVIGVNKIVEDFEAAVIRVKKLACPANTMRLGLTTYCSEKGECASCAKADLAIEHGCGAKSICNEHILIRKNNIPGRVLVLLVGEELGY